MRTNFFVICFLVLNLSLAEFSQASNYEVAQDGVHWIEKAKSLEDQEQNPYMLNFENNRFDSQSLTDTCGTTIQCGRQAYYCCPGDRYVIQCGSYTVSCN